MSLNNRRIQKSQPGNVGIFIMILAEDQRLLVGAASGGCQV
jgi:hypothetical protein